MLGSPDILCLMGLSASYHDAVKMSRKHTQIHNVITADGAVIDHDIPSPKGYSVPLLISSQHISRVVTSRRCVPS